MTQHEAGHQQSSLGMGLTVNADEHYTFECTSGSCDGITDVETGDLSIRQRSRMTIAHASTSPLPMDLHCIQSAERYGSALDEGFGHFTSARANNWQVNPQTGNTETDCTFSYYKEVLSPDLFGLQCGTDVACTSTPRRDMPSGVKAYPPQGINCDAASNWRDSQCGNQGVLSSFATELDFLQFFWSVHAQGLQAERLSMDDIYSTFRATCSGACRPCAGEKLRWASIEDTTPKDVRSLNDGAQAYLSASKLTRFAQQALAHGITPPPSP